MSLCPCGSRLDYSGCCGLYIEEANRPETPEALMRSRYTAYTKANIAYILKTMRGKPLIDFNESEARQWAEQVGWLDLKILESQYSPEQPSKGFVEFIARYHISGQIKSIHERSEFLLDDGQWYYIDSHPPLGKPAKTPRIAQNAPCFCGSSKKYKNCHGKK
ncbi:putative SEC-C motif domain protein [Legionella birminghamensis]|uniref:SEC-C motif domain protein n=1 Tax=Legionella birminghamensis TaxID=28083 RepID=A0A378I893_9GAMM|nr:YchJ family protein [Legionella birminghamensis]KTC68292.1 putative SEC-C motif domain protein [Legionella birminghamensis]STX30995.1 putative SEC-C motif domain protein [Legionella birminghamensis]